MKTFHPTVQIHTGNMEFSRIPGNTKILENNKSYECKVGYPFNRGFNFTIKTGSDGLSLTGFNTILADQYRKHYDNIHKNVVDDGYFHDIKDLYLEEIVINGNKITLGIGS